MKRLNVELDERDYGYLKDRAAREGKTLIAVIREAIAGLRQADLGDARNDPMYEVGSFEGPSDLADRHDDYLYRGA